MPPEIRDGRPYIKIYDKEYLLLDLMLEYYFSHVKEFTRLEVHLKNGYKNIPVKHIHFINEKISNDDEMISFKYGAKQKARNANDRAFEKITEFDVVFALKENNFKCKYCKSTIRPNKWHLDHIKPLHLNGDNKRENIASACKMCNIMKHAFDEISFYLKCEKIVNANRDIIDSFKQNNPEKFKKIEVLLEKQ